MTGNTENIAGVPEPRFVGVPTDVPTYFADTCVFAAGIGNTVRMQFIESVPGALDSTDPGLKHRYVFNVAMPDYGFTSMRKYVIQSLPEDVRDEIFHRE